MVRVASFNIENLFSRPKVFNTPKWSAGRPILDAYHRVNTLFANAAYSAYDRQRMRDLLVQLDIYRVNSRGAIRRKRSVSPRWARLRKNRGKFDRQPRDPTRNVEIVATGRADWIGWVDLVKEPMSEATIQMTARVIRDMGADIIGIIEAEDRPSLVRFNDDLLDGLYGHVMVVDGNDERGIDVGIMTREDCHIHSIRSNVDTVDDVGIVFSRDCPQYEVRTANGTEVHVLVNHFKSQSGGGGAKRRRQARAVRRIVDDLVSRGKNLIVLGDLNEGPSTVGQPAENFGALFDNRSPLVDCYSLGGFDLGNRLGTFDSCSLRNRLDYILISRSLVARFRGGSVFRSGLWGSRATRPTKWWTYPEMQAGAQQASDHAAVFVDLAI